MITYKDLFVDSQIIENNEYFTLYQNDDILTSYDRNMMKLHFNPLLDEFKILEDYQKDVHLLNNQNFLTFYWPQDQGIYLDVFEYLGEQDYRLGKTALLTINPDLFLSRNQIDNKAIKIFTVTEDNFPDYLAVNKLEDLRYGEAYAEEKQNYYPKLFQDERYEFVIAYYNDEPAGVLNKKFYTNFIEIDAVFVAKSYRKKGIATAMQRFVMTSAQAQEKYVALLADAEDTPYAMYMQQGYYPAANQITVQKVLNS